MSNLERAPQLTISEDPLPPPQPVLEVTAARDVDLGEGTRVRRLLPKRQRSTIGAWCFVDHFGPQDVAGARGMFVPPHPHIGLQTVTWLLEGEVLHRDSLSNQQTIHPGQLNLMTAGIGIAHAEESPTDHPAVLHGVQLWVALPKRSSSVDPSFDHIPHLPVVEPPGARITVIAGEFLGERSPARTYSDLMGAEVELRAGDTQLPLRSDIEYGLVALSGEAVIEGIALRPGNLLYLGLGRESVSVNASEPARLLLLGGEPFGEPIFMWWNFVAHSAEEIEHARTDWQEHRRFGDVTGFDGAPLEAPPLPPGRLKPRGYPSSLRR
jgi:redox-sensitive bicupin YhaK (pirin superfamily)